MKPIHALCASILCFTIAIVLGYFLWQDSTDLAFLIFPEFFDLAGVTVATVRSAAFVMLGVDVAIGIMGAALWYCARKADAKLKNAATLDAPERRSSENIVHKSRMVRAAFTLIEILVVIAIISILAALLLVGVVSVLRKGPETTTRNDLLQLSNALDRFKTEYGFYPPSRFKLCKSYSEYGATALDRESLTVISGMFKNFGNFQNITWAAVGPGNNTFKGGMPSLPMGGVILEGDQCLVFFLGGPPQVAPQPGLLGGFSVNPGDPVYRPWIFPANTQPYPTPQHPELGRKKFYDFETGRLFNRANSLFPSYLDVHNRDHGKKTPFAYFSAYKRPNGYSPFGSSDNAALGISPYIEATVPTTKYFNATTFQLFSAGPDGIYGPGGALTPGSAVTGAGKDDVCNFHDRGLGS